MLRFLKVILLLAMLAGCGSPAGDPTMASPVGWTKETFPLPPSFASFFPFHGTEIIRFSPGWGKKGAPDYWSYAYLWLTDSAPGFQMATLEKALNSYYTGLVGSNVGRRKIPEQKLIPVSVHLSEDSSPGTWIGTVNMLDYMTQEPILLHVRIRALPGGEANRGCLFIEVSPVPPGQGIWLQMDSLLTTR